MELRLARLDERFQILNIINEAKDYFKSQGIDQWQDGYPNMESIENDINHHFCYVVVHDKKIVATAAIIFEDDPNYNYIEDGAWLTSGPYGVIHRVACDPSYKGQGVASMFFEYARLQGRILKMTSLRVDTHEQNLSMQRLIAKNGFQYCGVVYMADGGKRFAYELVLEKGLNNGF